MSIDNQWLIIDNTGKKGANGNSTIGYTNLYQGGDAISKYFTIKGVNNPTTPIGSKANGIFVIYADGEHFNSRDQNNNNVIPAYFTTNSPLSTSAEHNLESTYLSGGTGVQIQHLYMSNIYEDDDLPTRVIVNDKNLNTNQAQPYQFGKTTPTAIITINHEITENHDMVVIVSNKLLRGLNLNDNYYYLIFDKVLSIASNSFLTSQQFFTLESISTENPSGIISKGTCKIINSAKIDIDFHKGDYTYMNIKPTGAFQTFYNTDLHLSHSALFEIVGDQSGTVAVLSVNIRKEF